jgi:septation ring formation regulator EzrA
MTLTELRSKIAHRLSVESRLRDCEQELAQLRGAVTQLQNTREEDQQLHRRLAELIDVVEVELLAGRSVGTADENTPGPA